jgi:hypothetical protein
LGLGRVAWEEGETAPPLQRSEEEGIATVAISLIRPQTENTKPPRALWVPFELGRPFGPPGDAAFQRRVILAALGMLERDNGWMTEPWAAQLTIIEMPRLTLEALYALRVAINGALLSLSSSSTMRGECDDGSTRRQLDLLVRAANALEHNRIPPPIRASANAADGSNPFFAHPRGSSRGNHPQRTVRRAAKRKTLCVIMRDMETQGQGALPATESRPGIR